MAEITSSYGSGGSGLVPNQGSGSHPPLATALRDIITDVTATQPATVAAAAAGTALPAFTDPPSAAEMATLRTRVNEIITLVNELRTRVNASAAVTLTSTAP